MMNAGKNHKKLREEKTFLGRAVPRTCNLPVSYLEEIEEEQRA
jgi:hypothetical protein